MAVEEVDRPSRGGFAATIAAAAKAEGTFIHRSSQALRGFRTRSGNRSGRHTKMGGPRLGRGMGACDPNRGQGPRRWQAVEKRHERRPDKANPSENAQFTMQ